MHNYGKVLDSASCGKTVYILTEKGCYICECGDEGVKTNKQGELESVHELKTDTWPFPS